MYMYYVRLYLCVLIRPAAAGVRSLALSLARSGAPALSLYSLGGRRHSPRFTALLA